MSSSKIAFNDVPGQWGEISGSVIPKIDELGKRGDYIGGSAIESFEAEFSKYVGSKYSIGVSNGTDALKIGFQMFDLDDRDAVVVPANTFIADYLALKNCPGKSPKVIIIDHDDYYTLNMDDLSSFLMNERSEYRKILVVPVHLYGHPCDLDTLNELKKQYDLLIMEDCSQAHGTKYKGRHVGYLGEVSAYSLYPGKNLGALGDAGIMTTDSEVYYKRARSLRNYGSSVKYHYDELGHNHRLDTIQAIILSEKLKKLDVWTERKREVASRYLAEIKNPKVSLPLVSNNAYHSYHIFCLHVDDRESFMSHMSDQGIPTIIHYPIPIHNTKIFDSEDSMVYTSYSTDRLKDHIVSIPIHPYLTEDEISMVIHSINSWE